MLLALKGDPLSGDHGIDLRSECPWATAFQGPGFGCSVVCQLWSRFEPVLVLSEGEDGRLEGLLALGPSREDGDSSVAGAGKRNIRPGSVRPI